MSKSERLFDLLTLLRSKRYAVTATELAKTMSVSERTIYRDIQSLQSSGVPIQGETGVGYMLQAGSHLPPLMLTEQEMVAFELGMRMVRAWSDEELAKSAQSASTKIQSVLPDRVKKQIESFPMVVADNHIPSDVAKRGQLLRHAIDKQHKVAVQYMTEDGQMTERILHPLGQIFWGNNWTLVAWCEESDDYRHFHLDRIKHITVLEKSFSLTESKSLPHCLSLCVNSRLV